MAKKNILLLFLGLATTTGFSWGFFAHKKINHFAVFTLPPEMISFFKEHIEFLSEHSVDPDKRRYISPDEAPRHYIDLDRYVSVDSLDFNSMPKNWDDAVTKYSEDTLMAHGIVPWQVARQTAMLTWAFRNRNSSLILKYAADLGHYVADAHVPLHTTRNYNGQLTNQRGIHGFWESRLPELFFEDYSFWVGRARYIPKPLDAAWEVVYESYRAKDSVLLFEAQLNEKHSPDRKYAFEQRGQSTVRVYSTEYSKKYHRLLEGMVERRMKAAVHLTGSLWYTAWVDAGQPDLLLLDAPLPDLSISSDSTLAVPSAGSIPGHED